MKGIVLSDLLLEAPKLKPIEFVHYAGDAIFDGASIKPCEFENVMLLCKNYDGTEYDAMWAFDNEGSGSFYLGFWNDGVTE
jgi:predicted restriction endonuclease